jgi:hypothetical protein
MKYGAKRYQRKRKSTVAKMAKGKTTSIQALAKSVRTLQLANKKQHQYQNYRVSDSSVLVVQPYNYFNLSNFSAMTPIFGADGDDDNNYKAIHHSFGMDCHLTLENPVNNEENTIGMTIFLVSLKDDIGDAFNPASGALSLTSGEHYVSTNGLTLLNKKCFNIHKIMRKTLTNFGGALQTAGAKSQGGADVRFYIKHSPRATITNVKGDWKVLQSAQDPSKQYYLLIFNDNSTLDGESPTFQYNQVHTMKTIV